MDFRYRAFISYRHYTPDQDIAKRLHSHIENYRIPAGLRKSLKIRRMGRVFRDQEELPLSSSLGDDIHEALEQSEWLICVCSPRYVESKWCMEELRYFLSLGREDRVLTLLAEGEPDEAFPELLRFRERNGVREEQEPLAADVRGKDVRENLKKLKREKLRVIAPMLGVKYDDLRQRARQRRGRMLLAAGAAVILLLSGFLGFAFLKNAQITKERNAALISQSKYLAKEADNLLGGSGDRMLALMLAKEAMPESLENPDRPLTDEAVYAMRNALVSGISNRYITVTDFDVTAKDFGCNGATLALCSDDVEGFLACYDLSTGREKQYPWRLERTPFHVSFSYDLMSFVWMDSAGIHRAYRMGSDYRTITLNKYTGFDKFSEPPSVNGKADEYVYTTLTKMFVLPNLNAGLSAVVLEETEKDGDGKEESVWIGDAELFPAEAVRTNDQYETWVLAKIPGADISLLRVGTGIETFRDAVEYRYNVANVNTEGQHVFGSADHEDYVIGFTSSPDGRNIVGLTYGGVYVWDTFTQEQVNAVSFTAFDGSRLKKMRISSAGSRLCVQTENGGLFIYDYTSGGVTHVNIGGNRADTFCFNSDGSLLLCCDSEKDIAVVVSAGGNVEQTIPAEFDLTGAYYAMQDTRGNGRNDEYLLLTGDGKTRLMKRDAAADRNMTAALETAALTNEDAELTADGSKLWYFSSSDLKYHLNILDLAGGGKTVIEADDAKRQFTSCKDLRRVGDRFMVLSGRDRETKKSKIIVCDAYTGEAVKEIHPSAAGTSDLGRPMEDDSGLLSCMYADGRYAVFGASGDLFYVFNAQTMEQEYSLLREGVRHGNNFIFEDGLMLMYYKNGSVLYTQVVSTETWQEEAPVRGDGCTRFCGMLHHAEVPGFSDLISVYTYNSKTVLMDLRTGDTVKLELEGTDGAWLTKDKKGVILRSGHTGGGYTLFNGEKMSPCEPLPEEKSRGSRREHRFLDGWVYLEGGVLYDSETGAKVLDCREKDLSVVSGTDNGSALLLRRDSGGMFLLRCLDTGELLELAERTLDGRELTEAQRRAFFLE